MSNPEPSLTIWGKIGLIGALASVFLNTIRTALTAPFRGTKGAPTFTRHVAYALVRNLSAKLGSTERRTLTPTTRETYEAFLKSKGLKPDVVQLAEGYNTKGCWIGDSDADVVVLFCHGGGYANYASKPHLQILWDMIERVSNGEKRLGVLLLEYDLLPARYPRQLEQAMLALQYLLNTKSRKRSDIILGGDSAGGNLLLGLLSHLTHSHPDLPKVELGDGGTLRGMFLLSPWVAFGQSCPSFSDNKEKDILVACALKAWSDEFLGDTTEDEYTTPLSANPVWWKDAPVSNVLITGGSDELLKDDIVAFGEVLKEGMQGKAVEVCIAAGEGHDGPLLEQVFGNSSGLSMGSLVKWVKERLEAR